MANKNIIVVKKPGLLIAEAYLQKAIKEATYLGTALVHEGKLIIDHQTARPTVEGVMKLQDALQEQTIVFCFGENKTILPEDMQPFNVLVDKDGDINVAVFMEGNFNGYAVKDSAHTYEWHCNEDFISKKLPKLFRSANAGLNGLMNELIDPITQQDLSNSWTDRGFITILSTEGEAITIANKGNIFKKEYSWGLTSNHMSYEEKAAPPPKEEKVVDKPMTLLEKLQAKKLLPGGTKAPEGLKETVTAVSAAALAAADVNFEDVKMPPEAKDWVNKTKSTWWIAEIGYQPQNYKDLRTVVRRTKGTKIGVGHPLASTNIEAATKGDPVKDKALTNDEVKGLPEKVVAEAPENMKDTAPKHVSMENMPILSPKQKLKLLKEWKTDSEVIKTLGDDMKAMSFDPKKLKELEDNYQTFYDGLGLDKETWLSFEANMKLGLLDVKALAQYAFNRQNEAAQLRIQLKSILTNPANKIADRKLAM